VELVGWDVIDQLREDDAAKLRIPRDGDQRSEVSAITIPK
jgi:hypothetical protein